MDALRDVLHQVVCQDNLAGRQLVVLLLAMAISAAFGTIAAEFSRGAEVVDAADLSGSIFEVERWTFWNIAQENADDVWVAIKCESVFGQ